MINIEKPLFTLLLFFSLYSCNPIGEDQKITNLPKVEVNIQPDNNTSPDTVISIPPKETTLIDDTSFVKLIEYDSSFSFDMRYATNNNFLHTVVYDCSDCLIRNIVAKALIKANKQAIKQGYRIRFFDCYRPLDVQKEMWKVYPNAKYVANPAKGSVHNRGGAVDITLETLDGKQVDMGTPFDHFGKEAHHDYLDLPDSILLNRKTLKNIMQENGFSPIKSEWWHYNFIGSKDYPISNFKTSCN